MWVKERMLVYALLCHTMPDYAELRHTKPDYAILSRTMPGMPPCPKRYRVLNIALMKLASNLQQYRSEKSVEYKWFLSCICSHATSQRNRLRRSQLNHVIYDYWVESSRITSSVPMRFDLGVCLSHRSRSPVTPCTATGSAAQS